MLECVGWLAGAGRSVPDGVGVAVAAIVGAQDAGNEHNRGLRAVEGDALKFWSGMSLQTEMTQEAASWAPLFSINQGL